MIKLIAFDLDGTLTQHKTPLDEKNKSVLNRLGEKYKLLMVGAGQLSRETWFTICEDTWFTTYTTNKFGAKA